MKSSKIIQSPKCRCKQNCYYVCLNSKCKQSNPFVCKHKKYQCLKPHQGCSLKLWSKFQHQLSGIKTYKDTGQKFKKIVDQISSVFERWEDEFRRQKQSFLSWKQNLLPLSNLNRLEDDIKQRNEDRWTGQKLNFLLKQPNFNKFNFVNKDKEIQQISFKIEQTTRLIKSLYENTDKQISFISHVSDTKSFRSSISKRNFLQQQTILSPLRRTNTQKMQNILRGALSNDRIKKSKGSHKQLDSISLTTFSPRNHQIYPIVEEKEDIRNKVIVEALDTSIHIEQKDKINLDNKKKIKKTNPLNFHTERNNILSKNEENGKKLKLSTSPSNFLTKVKILTEIQKPHDTTELKIKQKNLQDIIKKLKQIKKIDNSLEIKHCFILYYAQCVRLLLISVRKNDIKYSQYKNSLQAGHKCKNQSQYKQQLLNQFKFLEFVEMIKEKKFAKMRFFTYYYPGTITTQNLKTHQLLAKSISKLLLLQQFKIITCNQNLVQKPYEILDNRSKVILDAEWLNKEKWSE